MERTYWYKQTTDKPLFPDMLWSRPENKQHAGKLLIIGGNSHEFAAPGQAYQAAMEAGAGSIRVLLPSSIQKIVSQFLPDAYFAPSNASGSFAGNALADWLDLAAWSDGVLIAGDIGRSSETAIVLEKFLTQNTGLVVLTKDALDACLQIARQVLDRPNTVLVCAFGQLQKLAQNYGTAQPFTHDMGLINFIDNLHILSSTVKASIVCLHNGQLVAASSGKVCTIVNNSQDQLWRLQTSTKVSVWQLQNPGKPFEALATALIS